MNNSSKETGIMDLVIEAFENLSVVEDQDKLRLTFVNALAEIFNAGKVSFMLLDETRGELSIKAFQGLDPAVTDETVKLGQSFSGRVAQEGKPLLVRDIETQFPDLPKSRTSHYATKSFIIAPVKLGQKTIGVVSLTDKKDSSSFDEHDLKALYIISRYFALCAQDRRLDPLTRLFNHSYFHEQLLEEIYRCERYKRPLSILITDIDNFSGYNRDHGHGAGDKVLKQISKIIKEHVRQTDFVCRYAGEKFSVILPETKLKEAIFVAEKINEKIRGAVFTDSSNKKTFLGTQRLTASVGIAEHRVGLTKEELIQHAVSALQAAKRNGKNCVSAFK